MVKKKILIVGGNFLNKGAYLMVESAMNIIKEGGEDYEPVIIDSFPSNNIKEYKGVRVFPIHSWNHFLMAWIRGMISYSAVFRVIARPLLKSILKMKIVKPYRVYREVVSLFNDASCVIDISGYGYMTEGNNKDVMNYVQLVFSDISESASVPYIFFPQSFGPFHTESVSNDDIILMHIRRSLSTAKIILARENKSLSEVLKISPTANVEWCPDFVLTTSYRESEKNGGINTSAYKNYLVIIPNARLYDKFGMQIVDKFYATLFEGLHRYKIDVVVLRHSADDEKIVNNIARLCGKHDTILNEDYSPEYIECVISNASIVVGARYHGLVVALKNSVPCIATGWAHKYRELMSLYGLDNLVIDVTDSVNNYIIENIKRIYLDSSDLRQEIENVNSRLTKQYTVKYFFKIIKKYAL